MEQAVQNANIPSIAVDNLKDTELILNRLTAIRESLVAGTKEDEPVKKMEPRCLKDLLYKEGYTLQEVMKVISEIEKELL